MEQLSFFEAERRLLPELDALLEKRFRILRAIQLAGTIGRRVLGETLHMTEREIRNETEILRQQNLILILPKGMVCTEQGYKVLDELNSLFHELSGLSKKEQLLAKHFGIKKVVIVAGNIERDEHLLQLLGKEASQVLVNVTKAKSNIAVTGGKSVEALANFLTPSKQLPTSMFIPARGGIGHDMNYQANTIAALFAKQVNGAYRPLYLPEHLSEQAYAMMIEEPSVKEIVALYNKVNIVIHGIGAADEMVVRRNSSPEIRDLLQQKGAVGEAFGYYFDQQGNIVHHIQTVGIQLEQVLKSDYVLAIAGGQRKAKAIQAYFKNAAHQTILITDESAANEMINGFQ